MGTAAVALGGEVGILHGQRVDGITSPVFETILETSLAAYRT